MDLNFRKYIRCLIMAVVLLFAFSCVRKDDDSAVSGTQGAILFNVLAEPSSKLAYNGVHTSFVNNEEVGCVIAAKNGDSYEFKSVVKWVYQDGVLLLQTENDQYVSRHTYKAMADQGFVSLNEDMDYAFFFYYPYVEGHEPNNEATSDYYWEHYPMGVATDYRKDVENNISAVEKLSASDHLWVSYTDDKSRIDAGKFYEVPLTFQKKTATVEVHYDHNSGYTLDNVYIDAVEGSAGVNTRMEFNLKTGAYDLTQPYDGLIYPGRVNDDDGHDHDDGIHAGGYRALFAPQTITSWHLCATITDNLNQVDGIPRVFKFDVILEDKLQKLEEGRQYIFHIARQTNGDIMITDWTGDSVEDLFGDSITAPSDLSMWSDNGRPEEGGHVVIKEGETLIIKGKGFWDKDHCVIRYVKLPGVRVNAYDSESNPAGFVLSEEDAEGFRTISFNLPVSATDGDVYLVMATGSIKESPGSIRTVKPVVAALSGVTGGAGSYSFDMDAYDTSNPQKLTLTGSDLDLVESVTFGEGYESEVIMPSSPTQISVVIPEYAHSANLVLNLRNGLSLDSGQYLEILNPNDEVAITGISGIFKAGEIIVVRGTHLNAVSFVRVTVVGGALNISPQVSDDGKVLTFEFPENGRDGTLKFTKKDSNGYDEMNPFYEYSFTTAVPEYIDIVRDDKTFYIHGSNLDVVKTLDVSFNGGSIQLTSGFYNTQTHNISFNILQSNGDEEIPSSGTVTFTTKHDKSVSVSYKFYPVVTSVTSANGLRPGQTVTIAGRYLDEIDKVSIFDYDRNNRLDIGGTGIIHLGQGAGMTVTLPATSYDYGNNAIIELYKGAELVTYYVVYPPSNPTDDI